MYTLVYVVLVCIIDVVALIVLSTYIVGKLCQRRSEAIDKDARSVVELKVLRFLNTTRIIHLFRLR